MIDFTDGKAGMKEAVLPIAANSNRDRSAAIQIGDTHITIQGSADKETIAIMKRELATRDAEFTNKVFEAVRRGRSARQI